MIDTRKKANKLILNIKYSFSLPFFKTNNKKIKEEDVKVEEKTAEATEEEQNL